MSDKPILYGYNPSSYVFSVRILLAEKGVAYDQVPVDVIAGEPQQEAHRQLHPFGKVPVLEHQGLRVIETSAIMRYINDAFSGLSCIPEAAVDRARMDMAMSLYESYGYASMVKVVGAQRFPHFAGSPTADVIDAERDNLRTLLTELMRLRGETTFLADVRPSLADFMVAPACFYLEEVDELEPLLAIPGLEDWWSRVKALRGYQVATPDLAEWGEPSQARDVS